jgi:hypothetical protein
MESGYQPAAVFFVGEENQFCGKNIPRGFERSGLLYLCHLLDKKLK